MAGSGGSRMFFYARALAMAMLIAVLLLTGLTLAPPTVGTAEAMTGGSNYTALTPERIIDSRPASQVGPYSTPWGAGEVRSVNAAAAAGVPASGASAVAVNITTVSPSAAFSWLTVYPTGSARPEAASINFGTADFTSQITNDLIITKVDGSGNFTIYNEAGTTDIVIDVVGYYTAVGATASYHPLSPERIVDSRPTSQVGGFSTPWAAGESRAINATAASTVPLQGVDAVAVNVTTVSPSSPFSWLTIYPTGSAKPLAASVNFGSASYTTAITNDFVIAKVDSAGNFTVTNDSGSTHVVIDVVGYYSSASAGGPACQQEAAASVQADAGLSAQLAGLTGPRVPGILAATVDSNGLVRIGSAGLRVSGGADPVLPNDRVHLGSDTKSMTGALLALVEQAGGIGPSTLVTDVWPTANSGWSGVTMLDLLQHRGGAPAVVPNDLWLDLWASSQLPVNTPLERAQNAQTARAAFAATMLSTPPPETVGQYTYSNSGYMLVGAAMEATIGYPWEEVMCHLLFAPLGMQSCGFGPPPDPAPWAHQSTTPNLTPVNPLSAGADNPAGLGPAGTVHCPMDAWGKYLSWVMRGAQGTDERLPASVWQALLTPNGDYAAGWGVFDAAWANGPLYAHAGSNTMWFAVAQVAPGLDLAYLTVVNAATPEAQSATQSAISMLYALDN